VLGHVFPVDTAMDDLLAQVTQSLAELVVPRHSHLPPAVARVLRPGKLFRPRLTLGVAAALGTNDPDAAVRAATAVELLHMSSLIHDDLMDDSPERRGVPSIHVAASPASAVAMGDLLLARGAGVAAELGPESARAFAHALDQLWEGQLMESELTSSTSVEPHLRYIGLKTAALMEAAAAMGALSQGATSEETAHLARFGHAVGMAFQIADDLLDHIGDPVVLGKAVGADLPRGVVSVGAWHALALHRLTPHNTDAAVLDALAKQDPSVTYAVAVIGEYLDSARRALRVATTDNAVWDDARAMIVNMLEHGVLQRHRTLITHSVASWPA
jgi:geranylgeranyl pyrophosphate synthase